MFPSVYGCCNQQAGGITLSAAITQVTNDTSGVSINCGDADAITQSVINNYSLNTGLSDYEIIGGTSPYTLAWTFETSVGATITLTTVSSSGDPGEFRATANAVGLNGTINITLDVTDAVSATTQATCNIVIGASP